MDDKNMPFQAEWLLDVFRAQFCTIPVTIGSYTPKRGDYFLDLLHPSKFKGGYAETCSESKRYITLFVYVLVCFGPKLDIHI